MEGFCKGCLIKYDDPTELLQYTEKNRRLFVYSTGLQVKRNDAFPFQLCKDCYLNMKLACKFKKQCRSSDKRFKSYCGLKAEGDAGDFCTFLKNNDESLMFRLPMLCGSSTPFHQKARDEDNDSNCTSIRNFMTDIMPVEEIPDADTRIIREVIEEEADVLDDSLDSHWLQDDASIDTDFRLDLSFSPFSTPRSVNDDRCYTPHKLDEPRKHDHGQQNNHTSKVSIKKQLAETVQENIFSSIKTEKILKTNTEKDIFGVGTDKVLDKSIDTDIFNISTDRLLENNVEKVFFSNDKDKRFENRETVDTRMNNFYVETLQEEVENNINEFKDVEKLENRVCVIDKNLEEALQNEHNNEFSLDALLFTPPVFPGKSAPSTPTISKILFADKIDDENSNSNMPQVGQCIEKYDDVEGDLDIEEFLIREAEEFGLVHTKNIEEESENSETDDKKDPLCMESKFDFTDFSCKMCKKQYQSIKALKIHLTKYHLIRTSTKRKYDRKKLICDYCGKTFHGHPNLIHHIKTHMKPKQDYVCKLCTLQFSSQSNLNMHMTTHVGKKALKPNNKKYICTICGASSSSSTNLLIHTRRHTKSYSHECQECGQGYYKKSDLDRHIRIHNGMRPFKCTFCQKSFNRRDALNMHTKLHTDEKKFHCKDCDKKFIKLYDLTNHLKKSKSCSSSQSHSAVRYEERITRNRETYYVLMNENTSQSCDVALPATMQSKNSDLPNINESEENIEIEN